MMVTLHFHLDRKPLPLLMLGTTQGVTTRYFPSVVNAISERIYIPGGFPFGQSIHSSVYVSTVYSIILKVWYSSTYTGINKWLLFIWNQCHV
jgi:hypothetical protein